MNEMTVDDLLKINNFIKKLIIFIKKKIKNLFIVKKTIKICKLISLNVSK